MAEERDGEGRVSSERDGPLMHVVPAKTDRDLAALLRERIKGAYGPILDILNEANAAGLHVNFGTDRDIFGRLMLGEIRISRPL